MKCCQIFVKKNANKYGIKVADFKKLVPSLGNKTNYALHYRDLQLYLSLGIKLTKIHRVLKFKQANWMKKYIDFNTEKRKNTANVRLINNEKHFLKYTNKSTHITHKIFDKNYAALHEIKPVLTLRKPIYVEFTVLELSKWLIYDFHYNLIKKHFDAELLFTDTDSLTYEIKPVDVYEDLFKRKHSFDFSNLAKNSKLFDESSKMKVVSEGKIIDEFFGLKSKMHSMKNTDGKETNAAKGVSVVTEFKRFKSALFNKKIMGHKMRRIQSKNHKFGT